MTSRHPILLAAALLPLILSSPARAAEQPQGFDRSHATYTEVLARHVAGGLVDYVALRGDPALGVYLARLAAVERSELTSWPEADQLAFWINAYNAFTLRLILDHAPLKSIRSIGFLPGAAFRKDFIRLRAAGPDPVSLDFIEHRTIRRLFGEPRAHFALVCASMSCPPLRSEAYRGADLDRQLEEATRAFLSDGRKNRYDAATRTLHLSAIFKWFHEDFERASGSIPAFVARHGPAALRDGVAAGATDVAYEPYDWSLNAR